MDNVQPHRDRESRLRRRLELFVHRDDGREIKAVLTNVSEHGCRLTLEEPVLPDERVRIEVPRLGNITATIRWSSNGDAGAEFVAQSDVWEERGKGSFERVFLPRSRGLGSIAISANSPNLDG
jgi:hypothetical protein